VDPEEYYSKTFRECAEKFALLQAEQDLLIQDTVKLVFDLNASPEFQVKDSANQDWHQFSFNAPQFSMPQFLSKECNWRIILPTKH
jgi:hypothetical protein